MEVIHISFAGPERHLNADKPYLFEDHPYCGPVVLNAKGDPLDTQPKESSIFWRHVNAWYQQGKKTQEVGGKVWCVYETPTQQARRANASTTTATKGPKT